VRRPKIVDIDWLSGDTPSSCQYSARFIREEKEKVAVVCEPDRVRPVWFEVLGKKRGQFGATCGVCDHNQGVGKIINYEVWDGRERCQLV